MPKDYSSTNKFIYNFLNCDYNDENSENIQKYYNDKHKNSNPLLKSENISLRNNNVNYNNNYTSNFVLPKLDDSIYNLNYKIGFKSNNTKDHIMKTSVNNQYSQDNYLCDQISKYNSMYNRTKDQILGYNKMIESSKTKIGNNGNINNDYGSSTYNISYNKNNKSIPGFFQSIKYNSNTNDNSNKHSSNNTFRYNDHQSSQVNFGNSNTNTNTNTNNIGYNRIFNSISQ